MNNPEIPWLREKTLINPHNFRESLLAFGGLLLYGLLTGQKEYVRVVKR